jgi:hypothetical protein
VALLSSFVEEFVALIGLKYSSNFNSFKTISTNLEAVVSNSEKKELLKKINRLKKELEYEEGEELEDFKLKSFYPEEKLIICCSDSLYLIFDLILNKFTSSIEYDIGDDAWDWLINEGEKKDGILFFKRDFPRAPFGYFDNNKRKLITGFRNLEELKEYFTKKEKTIEELLKELYSNINFKIIEEYPN